MTGTGRRGRQVRTAVPHEAVVSTGAWEEPYEVPYAGRYRFSGWCRGNGVPCPGPVRRLRFLGTSVRSMTDSADVVVIGGGSPARRSPTSSPPPLGGAVRGRDRTGPALDGPLGGHVHPRATAPCGPVAHRRERAPLRPARRGVGRAAVADRARGAVIAVDDVGEAALAALLRRAPQEPAGAGARSTRPRRSAGARSSLPGVVRAAAVVRARPT